VQAEKKSKFHYATAEGVEGAKIDKVPGLYRRRKFEKMFSSQMNKKRVLNIPTWISPFPFPGFSDDLAPLSSNCPCRGVS